jgi:dTDP-L-rhamnose 4-epimerase
MGETVLITGGAGFIGRHVAAALLERGHRVRVLDALIEQVHQGKGRPDELPADAELIIGDIRDESTLITALKGCDSVIHLAAEVGVGQSMYAVDRYTSVNDYGTAVLFQQLIDKPVRKVVTASSMSVYGEGLYRDVDGKLYEEVVRGPRGPDGTWDPKDDQGRPLSPVPTPETKRLALASVYALGKYVQERLTLTVAPAYGMAASALRLWNAYGPGQALSNPYTGVLAIFASRIANGEGPMVFEDGLQRRDFVHVGDVAQAFVLALENPAADGEVFNIGSGEDMTVNAVAAAVARAMGRPELGPTHADKMRIGDIRHCIPDISKAKAKLGYQPRQDFNEGLVELAEWVARQEATDRVAEAKAELEKRGLVA